MLVANFMRFRRKEKTFEKTNLYREFFIFFIYFFIFEKKFGSFSKKILKLANFLFLKKKSVKS